MSQKMEPKMEHLSAETLSPFDDNLEATSKISDIPTRSSRSIDDTVEDCNTDPANDSITKSGFAKSLATIGPSAQLQHKAHFKPIVIPQTTAKLINTNISPFARAYPPELEPLMSDKAFLSFIDNLNEAFLASPIIRVLGLAGTFMQFDPTGSIGLIGMGIQLGAGLAGGATSFARTRRYINSINQTTFRPLGLRARILATKAMMQQVDIPEYEKFKLPALPEYDENWEPSAPELDPRRRRLQALNHYVADLDWEVAPMNIPDNFMKKIGMWQAKHLENMQRRKHERSVRRVRKRQAAATYAEASNSDDKSAAFEAKRVKALQQLEQREGSAWAQKRYEKRIAKINRDESKSELATKFKAKFGLTNAAKKNRGLRWNSKKHEWKEKRFVQRIRWIVITEFDWDAAEPTEAGEGQINDVDVGVELVKRTPPSSDTSSSCSSSVSGAEGGEGAECDHSKNDLGL